MESSFLLSNYVDGLMLSDGSIRLSSIKSGRYEQHCKHKKWLEIICNKMIRLGVKCKVDNGIIYSCGFSNNSLLYNLTTNSYPYFKQMRNRWYVKDYNIDEYSTVRWYLDNETGEWFVWHKTVPEDIILTPECVANWYLGDGCVSLRTGRTDFQIILSTLGFTEKESLFLSSKLNYVINVRSYVDKRNAIIISNKKGVYNFLNYINYYKVDCYSYKFPKDAMI